MLLNMSLGGLGSCAWAEKSLRLSTMDNYKTNRELVARDRAGVVAGVTIDLSSFYRKSRK
jgi:hypothetical protein